MIERFKKPVTLFILATLAGALLFAIGWLRNNNLEYWYLPYNLALGVLPLVFAIWLQRLRAQYSWKNWRIIILAVFWLLFLPNSFYVITDFIHLYETPRVDVIQDVVMLMQFSVLGVVFGFMSLSIMHQQALQIISKTKATYAVVGILLLSSFAIHLGRELRWNSWDAALNPLGVAKDVFVIAVSPFASSAASTTFSFFLFLISFYALWWYAANRHNT
jgi:uncharacterized membrane protein